MALKRTADGTVDLRTKEGKAIAARMAKARKAAAKKAKSSVKKTSDGTVDKRTKEGKAIAARMAKARASKNTLKSRIKRLFS